jgi:hypothetical protein
MISAAAARLVVRVMAGGVGDCDPRGQSSEGGELY